jgi:Tfp pilus assembly protein PilF
MTCMRLVLPLFILLSLFLAACSTGTVQREPLESGTPEVDYLLKQARDYRQQSQFSQADALLEQALRIDSKSPLVWYELASLKLDQGQLTAAEAMATKSLRFAVPESRMAAVNWLLISEVRKRQGNDTGAAKALQKAQAISGSLR